MTSVEKPGHDSATQAELAWLYGLSTSWTVRRGEFEAGCSEDQGEELRSCGPGKQPLTIETEQELPWRGPCPDISMGEGDRYIAKFDGRMLRWAMPYESDLLSLGPLGLEVQYELPCFEVNEVDGMRKYIPPQVSFLVSRSLKHQGDIIQTIYLSGSGDSPQYPGLQWIIKRCGVDQPDNRKGPEGALGLPSAIPAHLIDSPEPVEGTLQRGECIALTNIVNNAERLLK